MISMSITFCLLITTFFLQPSHSSTTTIQVDLVFPMNTTVYQPVYPFPLVFAISNFSQNRDYLPLLQWNLFEAGENDWVLRQHGEFGWNKNGEFSTLNAKPDMDLAIFSSPDPSRKNASSWRVAYGFNVGDRSCSWDSGHISNGPSSLIAFNTSIENGIMPDFTGVRYCSSAAGTVGITGRNQSHPSCLIVSKPPPIPTCAPQVDPQEAFGRISRTMADVSGCENTTWPNGTGIGSQCSRSRHVPKKSEGNVLGQDIYALVLSLVVLVLMF
jgi:hypothetical protein